jgi:hypothetical protein
MVTAVAGVVKNLRGFAVFLPAEKKTGISAVRR